MNSWLERFFETWSEGFGHGAAKCLLKGQKLVKRHIAALWSTFFSSITHRAFFVVSFQVISVEVAVAGRYRADSCIIKSTR